MALGRSVPTYPPLGVSLAFTRYFHHQYCVVHGIKGGGVGGGAYVAQWSCNSIAID